MSKRQASVDVLEGNKIIAEFMGCSVDNGIAKRTTKYYDFPGQCGLTCDVSDLKYHSSWDWLMPVVKKFDYLAENKIIDFSEYYEYWCDKIDDAVTRTYNIEPVFKVTVEAIEWYNTQTKKQ